LKNPGYRVEFPIAGYRSSHIGALIPKRHVSKFKLYVKLCPSVDDEKINNVDAQERRNSTNLPNNHPMNDEKETLGMLRPKLLTQLPSGNGLMLS